MKTNTEIQAVEAENQINYILQDHKDPFAPNSASVWVMTTNKKMVCRRTGKDVYYLLDEISNMLSLIKGYESFSVLATGWAAPLDENYEDEMVPPSEHPKRRRVRLVVTADDVGVASVLRFSDDPEEIIIDGGMAKGSLADAIDNLRNAKSISELNDLLKQGDTQ